VRLEFRRALKDENEKYIQFVTGITDTYTGSDYLCRPYRTVPDLHLLNSLMRVGRDKTEPSRQQMLQI
jgi:hypothetical protein